jgi:hypothetical protein
MKKMLIILPIGISLILLLGLDGSNLKSGKTESKCEVQQLRQIYGEYTVIQASELDTLQKDVNTKLRSDWRPMGGISYAKSEYCQVMVMPKK